MCPGLFIQLTSSSCYNCTAVHARTTISPPPIPSLTREQDKVWQVISGYNWWGSRIGRRVEKVANETTVYHIKRESGVKCNNKGKTDKYVREQGGENGGWNQHMTIKQLMRASITCLHSLMATRVWPNTFSLQQSSDWKKGSWCGGSWEWLKHIVEFYVKIENTLRAFPVYFVNTSQILCQSLTILLPTWRTGDFFKYFRS